MQTTIKQWLKEQNKLAIAPLRLLKIFAPINGLLIVSQAWLIAQIVNAAIFKQATIDSLFLEFTYLVPIFLLRFIINWQSERQAFKAALIVKQEIRERLFNKLRQLGPVSLSNENSGSLSNTLVEGVESLEPYFARYVPAVTLMTMVPLIIGIAILPSDWLSGVFLFVTAPIIPLFMSMIGKGAESLNQKQWRVLSRMGAHFLDVIQNLPTLKIFNASRQEADNIARISDEFRRTTMSVLRVAFLTSAVLEFFAAISIALIAVFIGFRLLDGEMAFLYGFFVLLLAPEFYLPLRNFGVQNHARMEAAAAAEDIVRVLDLTPTHQAQKTSSSDTHSSLQGNIHFKDIYFSYDTDRIALKHFSLTIEQGKQLAIVGSSGAGKSTIANLLLGFAFPNSGEITIGGKVLDESNIQQWRKKISWLPQKTRLFHGTVAENITLGLDQTSMQAIRSAAQKARALAFIEQLPQGFETIIGEGGQGLSGGQAQRIAIARAFVRNTPYLLLDEATAHLDQESEQAINEALTELSQGKTIISIAHRLHTIRHADSIAVMQNGQVIQQGNYTELAQQDGVFNQFLADANEEVR